MKKYITLFFLCLTGFYVYADNVGRTYNVQVLIFSHPTTKALQSEHWPIIQNPFSTKLSTETTPADQLQLEKKRLNRSGRYTVLFDRSWIRTWNGDDSTVSLPISNGANLAGQINIDLTNYFNVRTNVIWSADTGILEKRDAGNNFKRSGSVFYFQLLQNRRMKSNELNYIGQPVLGMLIKIIPVNSSVKNSE